MMAVFRWSNEDVRSGKVESIAWSGWQTMRRGVGSHQPIPADNTWPACFFTCCHRLRGPTAPAVSWHTCQSAGRFKFRTMSTRQTRNHGRGLGPSLCTHFACPSLLLHNYSVLVHAGEASDAMRQLSEQARTASSRRTRRRGADGRVEDGASRFRLQAFEV